jgi:hypothetical protein
MDRLVPREQSAPPRFEPGALRQDDELRRGLLGTQRGEEGRVSGHPADQEHPVEIALAFV